MPPRKRLGQLLTELGIVDEHQLQSALGHQKQWGGKLGAILVQKGFCKEDEMVTALSKHLGMPRVRIAEQKVDPRALKLVTRTIAEKLHVFAYEVSGAGRSEQVTIAMSDPTDLSAVDQLAFHTSKRIKPMLAGDSEIVQAISLHYADDKKATSTGPVAVAAKPAAPAPAAEAFPRRIEPTPARPAAARSAAPYIPPPIPAAPRAPGEALEEIQPDVESLSPPPAKPIIPPAVDLPSDDGGDLGLEPIAAHSQLGEIEGQEAFEDAGSASDKVEGLEQSGPVHAADAPPEGAAWQAPAEPAWDAAPAEPAAQADESWDATPEPEVSWDDAPTAAAEPEAAAWGEEAPAAEASAGGEFGGAQDWSETPADEWSGAAPQEGWPGPEAGAEPGQAAAGDEQGEELPADAILGTADELEAPAAEDPHAFAEAAPEGGHAAAETSLEAEQGLAEASVEAEQGLSEAPIEGEGEAPVWDAAPGEGGFGEESVEGEPALAEASVEAEAPAWGDAETHDSAEAHGEGHEAEPALDGEPLERAAEGDASPAAEHVAGERWPGPAEEEAPPAEAAAGTELSAQHETEAPDAWGASEDPLAGSAAEKTAIESAQTAAPTWEGAGVEHTDDFSAHEAVPGSEPLEDVDLATPEQPPAEEAFAAAEAAAPAHLRHDQTDELFAPPSMDLSGESEEPPAWVPPPGEPEPQGAGWLGEAIAGAAPLAPGDVETLASVGIDANDGAGALRLLAAIVRVLHRRDLLDPAELVAEIEAGRAHGHAETHPES